VRASLKNFEGILTHKKKIGFGKKQKSESKGIFMEAVNQFQ